MRVNVGLVQSLGAILLIFPVQAIAAEDWIVIASTDAMLWEGQARSLHAAKNNGGQDVVVASGRVIDKASKSIQFERWYVTISACRIGSGKLVTTDLAGTFQFENDFVLKGGNVASSLADMLCSYVLEADSKGITS